MAISAKTCKDNLRNKWVEKVGEMLGDEEKLRVASNKWAIPTLDEVGNEQTIILTVTVPNGSRDGEEYDCYAESENYLLECQQRAEKKRLADEKKAQKIAKDKKLREEKAKAKAKTE